MKAITPIRRGTAAALQVLGRAAVGPHGRRVAMLGDMLELGPTSAALHRGLNEAIKANHIDLVYLRSTS